MKLRVLLSIIFLLFSTNVFCQATVKDSLQDEIIHSNSFNNQDSVNEGLDLLVIGGLGIAWDNSYWGNTFKIAPAATLGIEIPFTKAHIFSFELLAHTWLAKSNGKNTDYLNEHYINLNDNNYSQIGLSGVVKCYLGNKSAKVRLSLHFGWLFLSPKDKYDAFDVGIGLNYRLNDNFSMQLGTRRLFSIRNIADGSIQTVPNLYLLNICYRFRVFK